MPRLLVSRSLFVTLAVLAITATASAQHFQPMMSGPGCPPYGGGAPVIDHYVQQAPSAWQDDQPVEAFLNGIARRSWIRFDYLHWNLGRPGNELLGAPVTDVRDPFQSFEVFDNLNGGASVGDSIIPTLGNVTLDDTSGIRGTLGVALNGGSLEFSAFGTEQQSSDVQYLNLQNLRDTVNTPPDPTILAIGTPQRPNVATTLLNNGVASDSATLNAIVYDRSFTAQLDSQMWGSEIMLLTDAYIPGEGLKWHWLGGFRYQNLDESLTQTGVFDNGGTLTPRTTLIKATTINNIYGPEVGARVEFVHRFFRLSATPRVAFALNNYTARTTSQLDTTLGAPLIQTTEDVDFTTVLQISFQGEAHLNSHCSIFGGYDLMWTYRVVRPYDSIHYNSVPGVGTFVPEIGLQADPESQYVHGLSTGLVFRY